jgi:hypothetical protein
VLFDLVEVHLLDLAGELQDLLVDLALACEDLALHQVCLKGGEALVLPLVVPLLYPDDSSPLPISVYVLPLECGNVIEHVPDMPEEVLPDLHGASLRQVLQHVDHDGKDGGEALYEEVLHRLAHAGDFLEHEGKEVYVVANRFEKLNVEGELLNLPQQILREGVVYVNNAHLDVALVYTHSLPELVGTPEIEVVEVQDVLHGLQVRCKEPDPAAGPNLLGHLWALLGYLLTSLSLHLLQGLFGFLHPILK